MVRSIRLPITGIGKHNRSPASFNWKTWAARHQLQLDHTCKDRLGDTQTHRYTDTQTHRQIETKTHRHKHTQLEPSSFNWKTWAARQQLQLDHTCKDRLRDTQTHNHTDTQTQKRSPTSFGWTTWAAGHQLDHTC